MEMQLKKIIDNSLKKAMNYEQYIKLVNSLVEDNLSTGAIQSEVLSNYTLLNSKRMKRWDKMVKVSEENALKIKNVKANQTWLVITESWCGDAAHIMPVINKVAKLNEGIEFKVVLRDENLDLMNRFLSNGAQAIPKLIVIDNELKEVKNIFGPRPNKLKEIVANYKRTHNKLSPEFKEELQRWYNKDKGQSTLANLISIL